MAVRLRKQVLICFMNADTMGLAVEQSETNFTLADGYLLLLKHLLPKPSRLTPLLVLEADFNLVCKRVWLVLYALALSTPPSSASTNTRPHNLCLKLD
jgi:hypothetical protein